MKDNIFNDWKENVKVYSSELKYALDKMNKEDYLKIAKLQK